VFRNFHETIVFVDRILLWIISSFYRLYGLFMDHILLLWVKWSIYGLYPLFFIDNGFYIIWDFMV